MKLLALMIAGTVWFAPLWSAQGAPVKVRVIKKKGNVEHRVVKTSAGRFYKDKRVGGVLERRVRISRFRAKELAAKARQKEATLEKPTTRPPESTTRWVRTGPHQGHWSVNGQAVFSTPRERAANSPRTGVNAMLYGR